MGSELIAFAELNSVFMAGTVLNRPFRLTVSGKVVDSDVTVLLYTTMYLLCSQFPHSLKSGDP